MQKHLIEFHIHMDKPSCVKKNTGRSRVWCQRAVTPVVWETEGGLSQSGVLRGGRLGSRTECTAWCCTVSKRKTKAENLSSLCRTLDSSPSPRTGRVDGDFNLRRCIQKKNPQSQHHLQWYTTKSLFSTRRNGQEHLLLSKETFKFQPVQRN